MFAEVLSITFICFLSGHHDSAAAINDPGFSDDNDISLPSWFDHGTQVEAGYKQTHFTHCQGRLCCPDGWTCCKINQSCCKFFHEDVPASSKYCSGENTYDRKKHGRQIQKLPPRHPPIHLLGQIKKSYMKTHIKHCQGRLCCPNGWICCNMNQSCCNFYHADIPASSKYCSGKNRYDRKKHGRNLPKLPLRQRKKSYMKTHIKHCQGSLCCPNGWICCNMNQSCCNFYHADIPASSKYCSGKNTYDRKKHGRNLPKLPLRQPPTQRKKTHIEHCHGRSCCPNGWICCNMNQSCCKFFHVDIPASSKYCSEKNTYGRKKHGRNLPRLSSRNLAIHLPRQRK
ncbi:progranulin [Halyomorpha halys]|uniref:progranulin n=1 Tax=Halyomorpha halys TaxID=286706 RepID=UPI0006D4F541|nr:granulins-like [Halyomorpha halys]